MWKYVLLVTIFPSPKPQSLIVPETSFSHPEMENVYMSRLHIAHSTYKSEGSVKFREIK